ncbi:MAG: transglycosylase SLT domain-containing protein, partial [Candidatus Rokuibacteriota bacterium]
AKDWAPALRKSKDAVVKATVARWNGTGEGLLNPDINVMFGAYFLGRLTKEFGEFKHVAAAYHQGPGTVRKVLAAKQPIPSGLPPKGRAYVASALKAHKELAA